MDKQEYIRINEIVKQQEQLLRFDHFSNKDAWEFGSYLVKKVYESGIDMAITIRKLNGCIIFQHFTEGTNLNNQNWMRRKFNTVSLTERSSLGMWAESMIKEQPAEEQGLDPKDYVFCGGGFPIRLKSGEIVAVLTVSNLPHLEDHQFLIDGLQEWLQIENVPQI